MTPGDADADAEVSAKVAETTAAADADAGAGAEDTEMEDKIADVAGEDEEEAEEDGNEEDDDDDDDDDDADDDYDDDNDKMSHSSPTRRRLPARRTRRSSASGAAVGRAAGKRRAEKKIPGRKRQAEKEAKEEKPARATAGKRKRTSPSAMPTTKRGLVSPPGAAPKRKRGRPPSTPAAKAKAAAIKKEAKAKLAEERKEAKEKAKAKAKAAADKTASKSEHPTKVKKATREAAVVTVTFPHECADCPSPPPPSPPVSAIVRPGESVAQFTRRLVEGDDWAPLFLLLAIRRGHAKGMAGSRGVGGAGGSSVGMPLELCDLRYGDGLSTAVLVHPAAAVAGVGVGIGIGISVSSPAKKKRSVAAFVRTVSLAIAPRRPKKRRKGATAETSSAAALLTPSDEMVVYACQIGGDDNDDDGGPMVEILTDCAPGLAPVERLALPEPEKRRGRKRLLSAADAKRRYLEVWESAPGVVGRIVERPDAKSLGEEDSATCEATSRALASLSTSPGVFAVSDASPWEGESPVMMMRRKNKTQMTTTSDVDASATTFDPWQSHDAPATPKSPGEEGGKDETSNPPGEDRGTIVGTPAHHGEDGGGTISGKKHKTGEEESSAKPQPHRVRPGRPRKDAPPYCPIKYNPDDPRHLVGTIPSTDPDRSHRGYCRFFDESTGKRCYRRTPYFCVKCSSDKSMIYYLCNNKSRNCFYRHRLKALEAESRVEAEAEVEAAGIAADAGSASAPSPAPADDDVSESLAS